MQIIIFVGDKLDSQQNDKYKAQLWDPNSGSYSYVSRICAKYY